MFPDAVQGVYAERKGLAGRDVSAKIRASVRAEYFRLNYK